MNRHSLLRSAVAFALLAGLRAQALEANIKPAGNGTTNKISATVPRQSAERVAMEPFANVADYGYMYWLDGLNDPNFRIQTSRYLLHGNHRSFGPTALGVLTDRPSEASALVADPPSAPPLVFSCRVTGNGASHTAKASSEDPRGSQIIESGKFFQHRWQQGTVPGIATDPARTGLEISAWPDRLSLVFRITPTTAVNGGALEMTLDLTDAYAVVAREAPAIALGTRAGTGFVFLPAGDQDVLDVDGKRGIVSVRTATLDWQAGRNVSVGLIVCPAPSGLAATARRIAAAETTPLAVTASAAEPALQQLPVTIDKVHGWHRIAIPKGTSGDDGRMRARIIVRNPCPEPRVVRFNFDGVPFYIPGITAVLRDPQGFPLGIPVQLSKNWHGTAAAPDNPAGFTGEWFHGLTMLTIPAASTYEFELMMTGENWGGMAAATHSQLSVIGYGGNQQWDESALGNRGEALCYDMDHVLTDNDFTDSRPFAALDPKGARNWGVNVGGGSVLRYFDSAGNQRRHSRMRVRYVRYCPNLTDVRFAGRTADGAMDLAYGTSLVRADDCTRGIHRIRISVNKDTSYSRLAFYQQAGDSYHYNQGDTLAYGNAEKPASSRQWQASGAPNQYTGGPVALTGIAPWVAITNSPGEAAYRPANHGFIIRSWKARLGGRPADTPYFREYRNAANVSIIDLVPPPDVKHLVAGDYVNADIVRVYVPRSADAYGGAADHFRRALTEYNNDPRMILREAAGNHLSVTAECGSLEQTCPLRIRASSNRANFTVRGGLGAVPVTFGGLTDYRMPVLEQRCAGAWRKVDQSVAGNDYWQCDFDPESRTWEITFTIRPDGAYQTVEDLIARPVSRVFRFRAGVTNR